jgi:two-component system response regulator HydG
MAATHQDLEQRVHESAFRPDLFFRLNVVPLAVPPLRARTADIPDLIEHFLKKARAANGSSALARFDVDALALLTRYSWPGNVRELQNLIERLVITSPKEVLAASDLEALVPALKSPQGFETRGALRPLRQVEDEYIRFVIEACGGNKTRAAEILGIDVSTIYRRDKERERGS